MTEKSNALARAQLLMLHADTIENDSIKNMVIDSATELAVLHDEIERLRLNDARYRWLRDWLDNNGLLVRAIRGESLAGYEHPDIKALRRENERLRGLLLRLREWDYLDGAADGLFWKREIEQVLQEVPR